MIFSIKILNHHEFFVVTIQFTKLYISSKSLYEIIWDQKKSNIEWKEVGFNQMYVKYVC